MEEIIIQKEKKSSTWDLVTQLALHAIVFLTPLFFLPLGIYNVSFNKQFLVIALTLVAFFSYLSKSLNEGKFFYKKGNLFILGFLIFSTISLFFSQSFNVSLFGYSGAEIDSFINIVSFVLIYFLLSAVIDRKTFKKLIITYLLSIFILLIYQFLQLFGQFILPFDFTKFIDFTPATNSIYDLSVFFGANLILILNILFGETQLSKIAKIFLTGVVFGLFIYILLIGYTFVWIVSTIAIIAILILKLSGGEIKIKEQNILITLLTVFIFLYFFNSTLIRPAIFQFNFPSFISLGYSQNINIIKNSYANIKNALLGSGPNTFIYQYLKFRATNLNQINNFWTIRFNSGYSLILTYFVGLGFLASVLFLLFILNTAIKSRASFFLPIFIYLISIFLFYNASYLLLLMFFSAAGIYQALYGETKEINLLATPQKTFLLSLITILLISGSVFSLYYEAQRFIASIYYNWGVQNINAKKLDEGISQITKTVSLDTKSDEYYRGLTQALLTKGDFANAINAGQAAVILNNINSLNYISLAGVYETLIAALSTIQKPTDQQKDNLDNGYKAALNNYKTAIKFDPKNPDLPLSIAVLHFTMNKTEEAKQSVDDVLILKPDYSNAYLLYSQIFEKDGKFSEAIEKAKNAKLNNSNNDVGVLFQLGNLYYKNNQLDMAQAEFENTISLFPNHSNSRYILGLIYDKNGLKNKAIEQFEKILKFNSDSEPIKKILENLRAGKSAI